MVFMVEIAALFIAVGAAGGFLSGMLGVGGGIIFVPALFYLLHRMGLSDVHVMHVAVATSLAIVSGAVMVSAVKRWRKGDNDLRIFKLWAPFLLTGVATGAFFASRVDSKILVAIFAVLTLLMGVYMLLGREPEAGHRIRWMTRPVQAAGVYIVGVLASMTGVGGAALMIPMMSASGVPMQKAVGTGSLLGLLVAVPGAIFYMISGWTARGELPPFSAGYVNVPAALLVGTSAMLAAHFGVRAAYALDKKLVRRLFAVVLFIVSLKMFFSI